ncbi:MAG: histidine phosphatase family protein [Planctomycetota bacterium]
MELILFRHGIAEEPSAERDDADRRLTPRGVERTRLACVGLARVCDRPEAVIASSKARARQTAAMLGLVFDLEPEVWPSLAGEQVEPVLERLRERDAGVLMLVGHEPMLSELVVRLCTPASGGGGIEMKKAGAACVEAGLGRNEPRTAGRLRWLLPPRVLRTLGEGPA